MQKITNTDVRIPVFTKLTNVIIPVSYRLPGNVIKHIKTRFNILQSGSSYKAIPVCSTEMKRICNLPDEIFFEVSNNHVYLMKELYKELVHDIVQGLNIAGNKKTPMYTY